MSGIRGLSADESDKLRNLTNAPDIRIKISQNLYCNASSAYSFSSTDRIQEAPDIPIIIITNIPLKKFKF
jgi:hypothetical protein